MKKFAKYALIAGSLGTALLPMVAHGQATTFSVESLGEQIGLGSADLKETVINILQLVLGLLALIAVIMIIIGGFTWLTAGGNEEKVDKAKKIISAAVIGLIIVLLAWAIVIFVARTTADVTQT
ncbi:MAG: hypothetical protein HYY50_05340 [Candidatus Kerfeldbacteria bacterium]|nr:hypothetical protein [Candidatus Kerfeldbacteria bacterium]